MKAPGPGIRNTPENKKFAILVNGGSFNPIHMGHLQMYTLARNALMQDRTSSRVVSFSHSNDNRPYTDVLIIYCVSPVNELKKKKPDILFDEANKEGKSEKNRIKLCRESFSCIDDVLSPSQPIELAKDGRHLSTNMFVWPEEVADPYNIKAFLNFGSNVTLFGLAGQDKVVSPNYYFLNGVNGNSIIVGRGSGDGDNEFDNIFNIVVSVPHGKKYDAKEGQKMVIQNNVGISSTDIRREIQNLRDLTKSWAAHSTKKMFITDCKVPDCISFDNQKKIIKEFQKLVSETVLSQVPNRILYALLIYVTPKQKKESENYSSAELNGYKQFRRFLFRELIDLERDIPADKFTTRSLQSGILQIKRDVSEITIGPGISVSSRSTIEFLQMTTGRALYIEKTKHIVSSSSPPKVCVLNFANANDVGGGVINGQTVQEETLCMMAPDLYLSLRVVAGGSENAETGKKSYADWDDSKWHSQFYYTNNGEIPFKTKDEFAFVPLSGSSLVSPPNYNGHVITAAAPNLNPKGSSGPVIDFKSGDFKGKMIRIIQNIAYVAKSNQGCDVLILGAWGCGAFAPKGNDRIPYIQKVASLFYEALNSNVPSSSSSPSSSTKFKDLFTKIIFPIPDCETYDIFKEAFETQTGGGGTGSATVAQPSPPPTSHSSVSRPKISTAAAVTATVTTAVALDSPSISPR
jgi:uncharacterized protein (TIGR02452 family)